MTKLQAILDEAVQRGKIPHGIVYATNKDGSFTRTASSGSQTFPSTPDSQPVSPSTTLFELASSTKLLTSIAVLQLLEQHHPNLNLQTDITPYIPELSSKRVLLAFDNNNNPILEDRKGPITFQHLLTHTSGLSYDALPNSPLSQYQTHVGKKINTGTTVLTNFDFPLINQPGQEWRYGASLDYAGKALEAISGRSLEEWFHTEIFAKLGRKGGTFFPDRKQVSALTVRGAEGVLVGMPAASLNIGKEDCFGGQGYYCCGEDYGAVLKSLLRDDGVLLQRESVEMLFTPLLDQRQRVSFKEYRDAVIGPALVGEWDEGIEVDFGAGNAILLGDDRGKRRKGTITWGGFTNTFWTIDREADVALFFATSFIPPTDAAVKKVISEIELAVYQEAGAA